MNISSLIFPACMVNYIVLLLIFLLLRASPTHAQTQDIQWQQTNGPFGGRISSLIVSGSTVFAGTLGGGVFRSIDNGTTWQAVSTELMNSNVYALTVSGSTIFAGTQSGGVFRSTDNGATWQAIRISQMNADVRSLVVSSSSTLFAGTNGGGVFRSTDNGTTWQTVNSGLTNADVRSLVVNGSNTLFAGTNGGGVFRSTDNGATWQAINSGLTNTTVQSLAMSGTTLFAGTSNGLFRSTDNGATWQVIRSGSTPALAATDIRFLTVSEGTLFAGGSNGGVSRSADNGTTWQGFRSGLTAPVYSFAVNGSTLLAGTDGGGILRSMDNGTTWQYASNGLTSTVVRSLAISGSTLLAGTFGGGVFRSTDNGATWQNASKGLENSTAWSLAVSGNTIFAGTFGNGVFRSSDSGTTWQEVNSGLTNLTVWSLAVSGSTLFAGTDGGAFRSTDNGTTWQNINSGLTNTVVISIATIGNTVFAGTDGGGIFRSTDNGTTWEKVNSGLKNNKILALAVNGNSLFAGTDGGGIFRSTDNGTTWNEANSGLSNATVHAVVVSGTTLFAGTYGGGIFRSTDNGANWQAVSNGLTITHVFSIAASGSRLFAGTYGGGVYQAENIRAQVTTSVNRLPFGLIKPGRDSTITLHIRNSGTIAGTFSASIIGTNAPDFSVIPTFQSVRIGVGDSSAVQIRFRPIVNSTQATRSAILQIFTTDGTTRADVQLTGIATQPVFTANSTSLNFGTLYATQSALRQTVRITNIGTAPGDVIAFAVKPSMGDFSTSSFRRQTLAIGASLDLDAFFLPQSAGTKQATLVVTAEGSVADSTINLLVSLRGEGKEIIAPTVITPFDGSQDVAVAGGVNMSWSSISEAESYQLQVARDRNFIQLVENVTVTTATYTTRALDRDAHYYWRVRAQASRPNPAGGTPTVMVFSAWNSPKAAIFLTEATPGRPRLRADTSVIDFGRVSVVRKGIGQGEKTRTLLLQALNGTMTLNEAKLDTLPDVFRVENIYRLYNTEIVQGVPRAIPLMFFPSSPGAFYAANLTLKSSPTDSSIIVLRGEGTLCIDTTTGRPMCPETTVELRLVGRQPANPLDNIRFQVWLTKVNLLGRAQELSRYVRRLRTTLTFSNNSMIAIRSVVASPDARATLVSPKTLPNRQASYTVIWEWQNPSERESVQLGEIVAQVTLGDTTVTRAALTEARWLDIGSDTFETTQDIVMKGGDTSFVVRTGIFPVSSSTLLTLKPAYPNPTKEYTSIEYTLTERTPVTIVLNDILGRTLRRIERGVEDTGEHTLRLDLAEIPRGTYYIFVATPSATRGERLEVKR